MLFSIYGSAWFFVTENVHYLKWALAFISHSYMFCVMAADGAGLGCLMNPGGGGGVCPFSGSILSANQISSKLVS